MCRQPHAGALTVTIGVTQIDAERFRREAEECRQLAVRAVNPLDKEHWLHLAAEWLKLAEEAEKRRPRF
jgi:hypothetical protein